MIARVPGWLAFAIVFLLVGAILTVFTAWVIALSLLRPPRMTDGKAMYVLRRVSPADLGLSFDTMTFDVIDQQRGEPNRIRLAAWWVSCEHSRGRCVVLLHGYADAKVGSIAWAPLWRDLGFNVLAIDLRAHGESEGRHTTGGFFERHDLAQALDQLQQLRPNETRQIVLFGISLGSAVALATTIARPELVSAVVLDCPFADYQNAATSHAMRLGSPTRVVMPLAMRLAEWISGVRFREVQPLKMLRDIQRPVFIVQSADDAFVGERDMRTIEAAANEAPQVQLWRVEGAEHLLAYSTAPDEYVRRLREFLERSLGT